MKNVTVPFDVKIDPTYHFPYFSYGFPLQWSGSVSTSSVADGGMVTSKAFGYLNTGVAGNDDLKDFQRDNLPYSKKVPNLPSSSHTYDLFMQSGQGTGGMFRPYSSSVGILSDKTQASTDKTVRLNLEVGVPALFHAGAGLTIGNGTQSSGAWNNSGDIDAEVRNFNFGSEPYFQTYGEKTGVLVNDPSDASYDEDQLAHWNNDRAVRVKMDKQGGYMSGYFAAHKEFIHDETSPTAFTASSNYLPQKFKLNKKSK